MNKDEYKELCRESLYQDFKLKHPELFQQPENQFTYLMFDGEKYKIGKSEKPEKRLKELSTGNPDIRLVCSTKNVSEKFLHFIFKKKKLKGEWFSLNEHDLNFLENMFMNKIDNLTGSRLHFEYHKNRRFDKNLKYIIKFGKYNGTPLIEMKSPEQMQYLKWLKREIELNDGGAREYGKPIGKAWKTPRYKAISWWLENCDKYINAEEIS